MLVVVIQELAPTADAVGRWPLIELATGILNVAAAAVVAITAWKGLSTWKHEARAKRGMELGEKILSLTYECLDVLRYMRNPWSPAYE